MLSVSKYYMPILGVCPFLATGCHSKQTNMHATIDSAILARNHMKLFKHDSLLKYNDYVGYQREFALNLDLPLMYGDSRGMHVRIWLEDSKRNRYVIDIKRKFRDSSCFYMSYRPWVRDSTTYIIIQEKKDVIPVSGYASFFKTIEGVLLPDAPLVKLTKEQTGEWTGFRYVELEIEQPLSYKFLKFPEPAYFKREDEASKKIYDLLNYLNKELRSVIYDIHDPRERQ